MLEHDHKIGLEFPNFQLAVLKNRPVGNNPKTVCNSNEA